MPDLSHLRERRRLARLLREARESTGLSGSRFAERLGWPQSRVSRLETGAIFPAEDAIRQWAAAAGTDPEPALAARERALAEYAAWKEQGAGAGRQVSIGQMERASAVISKFQPVIIPSQVRTEAYAAELLKMPLGPLAWGLAEQDLPARLAAQMARQKLLYEPGRLFELVILEAALTTRLASQEAMAGQLGWLLRLTASAPQSLDFRIIPAGVPVPVYPLSGFVIFDDHMASIETLTGEHRISDPDGVSAYRQAFSLLHDAAAGGRAAGELIRAALAGLST